MPFLVMRRTDIPEGVLQYVDLWPNTSSRNYVLTPGLGQTGYVRPQATSTTLVGNVALGPPVVATNEVSGLSAYLIGNIDTGAGAGDPPFTAAQADAAAAAIVARAVGGLSLTLANVNTILAAQVAATELNAQGSTGSLADVLAILGGAVYTIPAGTALSDGAGNFVARSGAFVGSVRTILDTGRLHVSLLNGNLSLMKSATFTYEGVAGAAIVVYDDAGNLL
jgi:hypothetical protein